MRLRYYRCYACTNDTGAFGRDFEVRLEDSAPLVKLPNSTTGEAVSCPNCGLSNTHVSHGGNVVPLLLVHFDPPLTKEMYGRAGKGHIACNPAEPVVKARPKGQELYATGEPLAVTCPKCKETAAFKGMALGQIHPSFDVPLPADEKGLPVVPELHDFQPPTDPTKPPAKPPEEKRRA